MKEPKTPFEIEKCQTLNYKKKDILACQEFHTFKWIYRVGHLFNAYFDDYPAEILRVYAKPIEGLLSMH